MRSAALSSISGTVREFFAMRAAETRAAAMPAAEREAAMVQLARAWQKRDAAEVLWPRGARAEALHLAAEALRLAKEGAAALAKCGADVMEAEAALDAIDAPPARDLEADVVEADGARLLPLLDGLDAVQHRLALAGAGPSDLAVHRRQRRLAAIAGGAVVVLLVAYAVKSFLGMHAKASGTYNALFPAKNVIDGDLTTEWLMPDKEQQGWIELTFRKRSVREVHILNAHSPPGEDRAIHEFTISCTDHGHPVKSLRSSMEFSVAPQWRTYDFGGVRCDALRIDVTSVHKSGGGIAEIEIP